MRYMRGCTLLAVAGAMLGMGAAGARAVPLSQLMAGPQGVVVSGDKVFSNFSATITGVGTFFIDPTQIEVVPIQTGADYGIQFRSNVVTAFMPIIAAGANSFADIVLSFDVTVTHPGMLIDAVGLKFLGAAPPDGLAQVVETISDGALIIGQATVQTPDNPTGAISLAGPLKTAHVVKDVMVIGGTQDLSLIYTIDQTFSQIPEPTVAALLGIGTLILLPRARRARRMLCIALACCTIAGFASPDARAVPLQQLEDTAGLPSGVVISGDKIFGNFKVDVATAGRTAVDTTAIDVAPLTLGGEYGIRFAGAIAALSSLQPNSSVTMVIEYDVAVLDPSKYISDVTLRFNGAQTGTDSFALVLEQVLSNPPVQLVVAQAPGYADLDDHQLIPGTSRVLHIVKTVQVHGGTSGLATISFIDQTFSQLPEPATAALVAIGALALRRRRT